MKFINPSGSLQQAELCGTGIGVLIGKHGMGHLGSVSPTRIVAGHTSANRNLLSAGAPHSGSALLS